MRPLLLGLCCVSLVVGAAAAPGDGGATAAGAGEGQEGEIRFDVWEYRIEGNTLLQRGSVERYVYQHLGPGKTIDDVEQARAGLERLYRQEGFGTVVVNIPEQDVDDGVVRLSVVEGAVGRLRVEGSRYFSLGALKEEVPSLAEGEVPHLPTVQEELAAVNRATPDRRVTPVLRPGRKAGTVEVELRVQDELPLHGTLEVNNDYTEGTEELRAVASLRYDNLWQRFHSFSLQYQTAPEDREQVEVWAGTYLMPLGSGRQKLALYVVDSDSSTPGATAVTDNVIGEGTIVGARAVLPLQPLEDHFHYVSLGLDYKDFQEDVDLVGEDTLRTPIEYGVASVEYNATLDGPESRTRLQAGARMGLRGLGDDDLAFETKRFKARASFFYLTGGLEHRRALGKGWQLVTQLDAQLSGEPLISNEQFATGGAQGVRGYLASQELGDSGVSGTVEVHAPRLVQPGQTPFSDLHLYWFADGAELWVREALPGQREGVVLASTGVGLVFEASGLSGALEWALPLKEAEPVDEHESRVHFRLGYEF